MRRRLPLPLASLALAASLAAAVTAQERNSLPELIERILAVVDERPLFLSEVRVVEAVRGLDRTAALEAAIDERLMHSEAAQLPQAHVSDEEVDEELSRLQETRPELAARVPEPELRRLLRRQATILKYVEFRFRPQIRVSPAEVRRAWEQERRGDGGGFEEAAPSVRARLERQAIGERIEEWVKDLRGRADIRYVPGEGSPSGGS